MKTPSFGIYANQTDKRWNTFIEEMNETHDPTNQYDGKTSDRYYGIDLKGDFRCKAYKDLFQTIITLDEYFAEGSVYRVVKSNCLMDNKKWYADNGAVYNHEDGFARIVLVTNEHGSYTNLPKDVAESIASMMNSKEQPFKRGERILVWDDDESISKERIAFEYMEGFKFPVLVIEEDDEQEFIKKEFASILFYKHWKPLPKENPERQKLQQEIEQLEKELQVKRDKLSGL